MYSLVLKYEKFSRLCEQNIVRKHHQSLQVWLEYYTENWTFNLDGLAYAGWVDWVTLPGTLQWHVPEMFYNYPILRNT